ncbi:hypothetical protein LR48_Vigan09g001300 [Vigna angularis]|uniref:C2 NT-type domain-containing protein n=1 Tax=Phaseolus angularis TaxID=3914 RepID=A0A0L9V9N5_PHAAN|nr:hypothetical protein LR48_Vigan09g001300 [Vigna angularis]
MELLPLLFLVHLAPPTLMGGFQILESMESSSTFGKTRKSLPPTMLPWVGTNFMDSNFLISWKIKVYNIFVEQKGEVDLDLVCVFNFNLRLRDGVTTTKVKGVNIILDDDIWANVAKLPICDDGIEVHLGGVNVVGEKKLAIQAAGFEIGENTMHQMGFISRGNIFVHKYDAKNEGDDDEDAHMAGPVNVADTFEVGSSDLPSSSFLSIEEQIANLSRHMEQMSTLQQSIHVELMKLQLSHHEYQCEHLNDFDIRLGNIESY